jgi:hypothetical protein
LDDAANDANGRALVEEIGTADGELVKSDHGYGGSVLARGQRECALSDSVGAGRGDGLINEVALEENGI